MESAGFLSVVAYFIDATRINRVKSECCAIFLPEKGSESPQMQKSGLGLRTGFEPPTFQGYPKSEPLLGHLQEVAPFLRAAVWRRLAKRALLWV